MNNQMCYILFYKHVSFKVISCILKGKKNYWISGGGGREEDSIWNGISSIYLEEIVYSVR